MAVRRRLGALAQWRFAKEAALELEPTVERAAFFRFRQALKSCARCSMPGEPAESDVQA
jgi:hypothetical protein